MRRLTNWKKLLLLVWACALAFGITFQSARAEATHSRCTSACARDCGSGNCAGAFSSGCSCLWTCEDGSTGESICVR